MTAPKDDEPLLDASVRLDALPAAGRHVSVAANAEQCAAIARRLGILSVEKLGAELTARPLRGGIEVSGDLTADVIQVCVVSFEPVPEHIEERLFRLFLAGPADEPDAVPGAEVYVDLEDDDLPDHFLGPEADLSEWLIEILSLALNPYPRKPGAEIDSVYRDDEAEGSSPFESLKALKSIKD